MQAVAEQSYLSQRLADFTADSVRVTAGDRKDVAEIGQRIGYAVALYRMVLNYSETSSSRVPFGSEEHLTACEHIEGLLQLWLPAAQALSAAVQDRSFGANQIPYIEALADAILEVRVTLSIPARRFFDREVRIARQGLQKGKTTQELRLELQRRVGA